MAIDSLTALIFLPFVLPICIWVAWNDMKYMKIPNKAVYALVGIFVVLGLVALPLETYLWRLAQGAAVLVITFVLNQLRAMGAGDSKFIAAAAPFIDPGDGLPMVMILAGTLLAAFATHRAARAIKPLRRALPDWQSWERGDFPMGLALGASLLFYLILGVILGGSAR